MGKELQFERNEDENDQCMRSTRLAVLETSIKEQQAAIELWRIQVEDNSPASIPGTRAASVLYHYIFYLIHIARYPLDGQMNPKQECGPISPFTELIPEGSKSIPIVYDSPHSGRTYPLDFRPERSFEDPLLRRAEDAYVDLLISPSNAFGIHILTANFPRAYIDANRHAGDVDAELLSDPESWDNERFPLCPTRKSELGLGLVRRYVIPGIPVYNRKLKCSEIEERLSNYYVPYRQRLDEVVREARSKSASDFCFVIDWHSMKSKGNEMTPDGPGKQRPDMVIGSLDHHSCDVEIVNKVVEIMERLGFRVAVNDPYKGADIVKSLGRPEGKWKGVHVIQIEMNRALYLHEETVRCSDGFADLQAKLSTFSQELVHYISSHSDPACRK